ncbi:MAG: hypothetical protein D3910_02250, partial [Candidatus Electrothrix sp. ATG2]|nr:hypothetical protein [Candidatus Electrothrix sp. ATG2]
MPLLIGCFAERSVKSKNDLAPLATLAGILILFTLYLIFIDQGSKKKKTDQPPPTSVKSTDRNFNTACCSHDDSCQQGRAGQHACESEEQLCEPVME